MNPQDVTYESSQGPKRARVRLLVKLGVKEDGYKATGFACFTS